MEQKCGSVIKLEVNGKESIAAVQGLVQAVHFTVNSVSEEEASVDS